MPPQLVAKKSDNGMYRSPWGMGVWMQSLLPTSFPPTPARQRPQTNRVQYKAKTPDEQVPRHYNREKGTAPEAR